MFLSLWILTSVPAARTDAMLAAFLPRMYWANWFWGLFNLIPVPPLDGGHAARDFFRLFLSERNSFVAAVWLAIPVGAAVAIWMLIRGQIFIALFVAWFVYMVFQQWLYFREHGIPGD
jgi:Zn-dependent protease